MTFLKRNCIVKLTHYIGIGIGPLSLNNRGSKKANTSTSKIVTFGRVFPSLFFHKKKVRNRVPMSSGPITLACEAMTHLENYFFFPFFGPSRRDWRRPFCNLSRRPPVGSVGDRFFVMLLILTENCLLSSTVSVAVGNLWIVDWRLLVLNRMLWWFIVLSDFRIIGVGGCVIVILWEFWNVFFILMIVSNKYINYMSCIRLKF